MVLVESAAASTTHRLLLSGLLPNARYTCEAVPTCPTAAGPGAAFELTTEGPPLPDLEVEVDPALGMTGAFTLMPFRDGACSWRATWLAAWDPDGRARWWHQLPDGVWADVEALWHPEDDTIVWGGGEGEGGAGRTRVLARSGEELYDSSALPGWEEATFHHDGKRLADGRILTLEMEENEAEDERWTGFRVRAHDPASGEVSVQVGSQRYVDEGALRTAGGWDQDPYHANWVDLVDHPSGARLYVSLCFDHRILAIDAATGDLRWSLAQDEGWSVVDGAGAPLPQAALPECQHGLEVVGDDVLLVYDNGQDRRRSQITELHVDPVARRVTIPFRWADGWFEDTLGDVDDLGNGRILVTQAHPECWSPSRGARSSVVEVDRATGRVASRLTFPDPEHTTYRSQRYAGCELLPETRWCDATVARLAELGDLFGRAAAR